MENVTYLICCIVLCALSGLLGYFLGHREGTLEGFISGAMTFLTENDDFLAYSAHLIQHMEEKAKSKEDDDGGYDVYP